MLTVQAEEQKRVTKHDSTLLEITLLQCRKVLFGYR